MKWRFFYAIEVKMLYSIDFQLQKKLFVKIWFEILIFEFLAVKFVYILNWNVLLLNLSLLQCFVKFKVDEMQENEWAKPYP